jgi:AcrR family transcriptional regulator
MSPRPYHLGQRQVGADRNRARVVRAARALLAKKRGVDSLSVEAIAKKAGVTRMTVYLQFKSKGGVLRALFDELAAGGGMQRMPEAFRNADARDGLRQYVAILAEFWASDPLVIRRVRNLATLDPQLAEAVRERDGWRRDGLRILLTRLGRPKGVSLDDAVDALHVLTSFETFEAMSREGRAPTDVAAVITRVAFAIVGI